MSQDSAASPSTRAPDGPALMDMVRDVSRAIDSSFRSALSGLDLQPAHVSLLRAVAEAPGVSRAELARHLGVSHQNIAKLISRLSSRQLLRHRTEDVDPGAGERWRPDDDSTPLMRVRPTSGRVGRPGACLELTDQGWRLLDQAVARLDPIEARLAADLSDPAVQRLRRTLDGMVRNLAPAPAGRTTPAHRTAGRSLRPVRSNRSPAGRRRPP